MLVKLLPLLITSIDYNELQDYLSFFAVNVVQNEVARTVHPLISLARRRRVNVQYKSDIEFFRIIYTI